MEVMEAEWSSKVWTKLKLFCTSKTWISRSRPAEASNLWPTSEEKRLPRIRKLSLKWESELSFTYPISNSPLTLHPPPPPHPQEKSGGKKGSDAAYSSILKHSSKRFKFSPGVFSFTWLYFSSGTSPLSASLHEGADRNLQFTGQPEKQLTFS